MIDRPRRSTRVPIKYRETSSPTHGTPSRTKRKSQPVDPMDQLDALLKSSKSLLTTLNISDLINASSWSMLSAESQECLKALLPPTAFHGFKPSIDPHHPLAGDSMDVDQPTNTSKSLDMSIFTETHFLAAAHTFQDHIYSGWMTDAHAEKVRKFQAGIIDGTLAAAWKDEIWERDHQVPRPVGTQTAPAVGGVPESSARAGEAAEIKLLELARNGVIRAGDILAYRRNFSNLGIVIEKDIIIQSIHPKSYYITVLLQSGTTQSLPAELVSLEPAEPSQSTQSMIITSPTMLETGLLDLDARVERAKRPNGNAWKCFTVWRWRKNGVADLDNARGGRENHGTLFYLRGTYYHER